MKPSRSMIASSSASRAAAARSPAPQLERPGLPRRQRGARKDRRAELEFEPAARGDLAVVGQRLSRRLGDPRPVAGRAHPPLPLRRAGEPRLARAERLTRHALEQLAGRRGDRDAVGLVVARMEQRGVAGRHQRQPQPAREGHAPAEPGALLGQPAQPHPQPAGARVARRGPRHAGRRRHAGAMQRDRQPRRLDHHVEPGGVLGDAAREVEAVVEMARGQDAAQVGVAAPVERQQQRRGAGLEPRDLGAQQRREPRGARRAVEAHREVEVVAVGERERSVAQLERALDQRLGRGGAEQQRAVRARAQRDEGAHGACPAGVPRRARLSGGRGSCAARARDRADRRRARSRRCSAAGPGPGSGSGTARGRCPRSTR